MVLHYVCEMDTQDAHIMNTARIRHVYIICSFDVRPM